MWKCQQLSEVARALITPRLFIEAAFFESTVTVMTAGAMWGQEGQGVQRGFIRASLPERLNTCKLQHFGSF